MRSKGLRTVIIGILIIGLLAMAAPAYAQNAGKKLGRGFVNAVTGWLEIPYKIHEQTVEHNILVGLTWGVIKGAGYTVARTVTGAYEIATFPFPIPADYEPIMQPEYVFSQEE